MNDTPRNIETVRNIKKGAAAGQYRESKLGTRQGVYAPRHSTTEHIPPCNLIKNRTSMKECQITRIDKILVVLFDWLLNIMDPDTTRKRISAPQVNLYCPGPGVPCFKDKKAFFKSNRFKKGR